MLIIKTFLGLRIDNRTSHDWRKYHYKEQDHFLLSESNTNSGDLYIRLFNFSDTEIGYSV